MFRISVEDRDYATYRIIDNKTGKKQNSDFINPVNAKLFNFDTFNMEDGNFTLKNSSVRETSIAGVLVLEGNKTYGKYKDRFLYKCVPDDRRLPIFLVPYKISQGFIKIQKNRYVIIYFKNWDGKHPIGTLDQNIGQVGELPSFYQYQLYCRSLNTSIQAFTKDALKQLKKQPEYELINNMIAKYKVEDRRSHDVITIDPVSSKDFDDGVGMVICDNKTVMLSVYIANVPLWLDYLDLWNSFSKRIATIYLPDRKLPMLPTVLSDILCSLQCNSSRFALALDLLIDLKTGEILKKTYSNVVINVNKNLRYDSFEQENNKLFCEIFKVVSIMNKKNKYVCNIKNCHDVIAYLMILMNHLSAEDLSGYKTGLYRTMSFKKLQESINVENEEVKKFLMNWNSTGGYYKKYEDMSGHEALNLDRYLHITSPIRRLVDLLNIIELQEKHGIVRFTPSAKKFYNEWTSETSLNFINDTMKSIRKVQSDCSLLHMCSTQDSVLDKIHKGYIFDKMQRTDLMYQYQVYLLDLRVVRRFVTSYDLEADSYNVFKLHLFMDEDRLYKRIRLGLVS